MFQTSNSASEAANTPKIGNPSNSTSINYLIIILVYIHVLNQFSSKILCRLWECLCSKMQAIKQAKSLQEGLWNLLCSMQLRAPGHLRALRGLPVLRFPHYTWQQAQMPMITFILEILKKEFLEFTCTICYESVFLSSFIFMKGLISLYVWNINKDSCFHHNKPNIFHRNKKH